MTDFDAALRTAFGDDRVARDAPLAPLTTFKVGGPADWLLTLRTADEIGQAIMLARDHAVPVSILGGGSNLLIADQGVRGLVIRVRGGEVRTVNDAVIRADAGVTINGLVRWTLAHGLAGLEAWAGTPGTVGGAVYGNAHFQGRLISELIVRVDLVARDGSARSAPADEMEFAYDFSRLHRTGEVVAAADFRVRPGDPAALREVARASLAFRKRTQPLENASAGCIFQNPDPSRDRLPDDVPYSAGALVDRAGLKGASEGGARVSARHGNFIVNEHGASAADISRLIDVCRRAVAERFQVELRDEIVRLGFGDTHDVDIEG